MPVYNLFKLVTVFSLTLALLMVAVQDSYAANRMKNKDHRSTRELYNDAKYKSPLLPQNKKTSTKKLLEAYDREKNPGRMSSPRTNTYKGVALYSSLALGGLLSIPVSIGALQYYNVLDFQKMTGLPIDNWLEDIGLHPRKEDDQ